MTTRKQIEQLIQQNFGNVGHNVNDYYYCEWLNHHAVVQVINEAGGVRSIISYTSRKKLYDALDSISDYNNYLKYVKEQ